jgi:integrase
MGFLTSSPVSHVPEKPAPKRREVAYSNQDWQQLRGLVKDNAFGDLLDFMWEAGYRPLETRTMESRHINLESGVVVFPPSEAKGAKRERVIYLPERAIEICRNRIDHFPEGPIMRNGAKRPWTKDAINCRFLRLRKKLGRNANAYAIRHSYATNGLIEGMDSLTLSQLMGNAHIGTLAKNYSNLATIPNYLRQQARSLTRRTS